MVLVRGEVCRAWIHLDRAGGPAAPGMGKDQDLCWGVQKWEKVLGMEVLICLKREGGSLIKFQGAK